MMTYNSTTGEITLDNNFEGMGYSGTGEGRNNPVMQDAPNVGPIPRGHYRIGPMHDHPKLGPCVFDLIPQPGTNTWGRSAFRIHGDNINHDASHGCIIAGLQIRKRIRALSETELEVK